jgi:hypothetical protein
MDRAGFALDAVGLQSRPRIGHASRRTSDTQQAVGRRFVCLMPPLCGAASSASVAL